MRISLAFCAVETETDRRPQQCPRCGGRRFHRHVNRRRKVRDTRIEVVQVVQYQCGCCQRVLTVHPQGISRAQQTQRLRMLSVTLYVLGLPYEKVKLVLEALGAKLSTGKIWENVQEAGVRALQKLRAEQAGKRPIVVLGADEMEMKVKGEGITVGFVTDPKSGQIVGLARL